MMRAVLALLLLAGCSSGGDTSEAYCDTLRDERAAFVQLADDARARKQGYLTDALALFERMQREAPDTLRDEWDTVVFAWSDLVDALRDSGADPATFDPEKRPEGLTDDQFATVKDVAGKLSTPRVRDAAKEITQHARDACDVELSL